MSAVIFCMYGQYVVQCTLKKGGGMLITQFQKKKKEKRENRRISDF